MSYTRQQLDSIECVEHVDIHLLEWKRACEVFPSLRDSDTWREHVDQLIDRRLELMRVQSPAALRYARLANLL